MMRTHGPRRTLTRTGSILFVSLFIVATFGLAAVVGAPPTDPSRIAAFFPPWWSQARSVAAAASAGDILGVGAAPFVVIVHGDPTTLSRRVRAAGAMFVLASDPLGYCNPPAKVSRS
jgi:hypothetical protein